MTKLARIAVDCCGEIRRIIWPLKARFAWQNEGIFKQYTDEICNLVPVGLFVFTTSMKDEFEAF